MGVLTWVLGLFGGNAGEAVAGAAKDLGLAWLVKGAVTDLLSGSALAFARFEVLGGVAILLGLLMLHFWRGESWAGKFRAAWWLWLVAGCVAAFLVLAGTVDMTVTRVLAARAQAERTFAELPLPEPARRQAVHDATRAYLKAPAAAATGNSSCAGCE